MDPAGDTWTLQEITERLPGRVEATDSGALARLLHETAINHGAYEAVAPAARLVGLVRGLHGRAQGGSASEEAAAAAGRYMADVKQVVVTHA